MATLDKQVAASYDDIRVRYDSVALAWEVLLGDADVYLGNYSADELKSGSGNRFLDVPVPKGATITEAHLSVCCYNDSVGTVCNARIRGEAADNPAEFSDYTDYSGRPRTSISVDWDAIAAWYFGEWNDSPDIKAVIQEIIDRAGWESGNAMVIFLDDHDGRSDSGASRQHRTWDTLDNTYGIKLHIEYTPPAVGGSRGFIIG